MRVECCTSLYALPVTLAHRSVPPCVAELWNNGWGIVNDALGGKGELLHERATLFLDAIGTNSKEVFAGAHDMKISLAPNVYTSVRRAQPFFVRLSVMASWVGRKSDGMAQHNALTTLWEQAFNGVASIAFFNSPAELTHGQD